MLSWIQTNIGSIIVVLILLVVVALIIRRLILDKRAGKCTCGTTCKCSCTGCPMQEHCHEKKQDR